MTDTTETTFERMKDLPRLVAAAPAGREATLEVWRGGSNRTLSAELAASPDAQKLAAADPAPGRSDRLGLTLAPLTDEHRRSFGVAEDVEGALITAVEPDSPAASRGLRRGDVLVMAGQQQVESPEDVQTAVGVARKAERKSVLFLVHRKGNQQFVTVPFEHA